MLRFGRVEVTGGFLLLMAWLNYGDTQRLLPLGVCAAMAHEAGHWLVIRMVGGRVSRLRLSVVGADMRVERPMSYGRELICALAGPAINLLLGYWSAQMGWLVFSGMNVALGMFNLLPVGVLDGGRALRCVVALVSDADGAVCVQRWLDFVVACGLVILGMMMFGLGGGTTLVVIGMWLLCPFVGRHAEKWRKGLAKAVGNR